MNRRVKEFVELSARSLPLQEPILEIGSRLMPGQEGFANLRPLFPGKEYIGADYVDGPGVDRVLDVQNLQLPDSSVGSIICTEVVEHVRKPFDAAREMHRVLRDGGVLIVTAPMNLRIHGSPFDYWRYTEQGFHSLLDIFDQVYVTSCGDPEFPNNIAAVAVKGRKIPLGSFEAEVSTWRARWCPHRFLYCRQIWRKASDYLPAILTGSTFEFWLRNDSQGVLARARSFAYMLIPRVVVRGVRRIKSLVPGRAQPNGDKN